MARTSTGTNNGHSHQFEFQASKKSGAPRTSVTEGHDHGVERDANGRVIRIKRAGKPEHIHPIR